MIPCSRCRPRRRSLLFAEITTWVKSALDQWTAAAGVTEGQIFRAVAEWERCGGKYGIGICSIEEVGSFSEPAPPSREPKKLLPQPVNGNYGGPKVRDRLCQLIRQHQLDANLVKSYAVDFCGAKTLRDATREQVEGFVAHLADWAEKDRNALLCQLNSYPASQEGAA